MRSTRPSAPEPTAAPAEPVDDALEPDPQTHRRSKGGRPASSTRAGAPCSKARRVADLPESDQLPGTPIVVTDRRGDAWTTTLTDVVSRSDTEIVVTKVAAR